MMMMDVKNHQSTMKININIKQSEPCTQNILTVDSCVDGVDLSLSTSCPDVSLSVRLPTFSLQ